MVHIVLVASRGYVETFRGVQAVLCTVSGITVTPKLCILVWIE